MNTLTSDQATESDYQLDLMMQDSGPSCSSRRLTESRKSSTGFKLADLKVSVAKLDTQQETAPLDSNRSIEASPIEQFMSNQTF